jgi:hypothetical protein
MTEQHVLDAATIQGSDCGGTGSANDKDQAAGTRRRNHWQPTLSPLACILWLSSDQTSRPKK